MVSSLKIEEVASIDGEQEDDAQVEDPDASPSDLTTKGGVPQKTATPANGALIGIPATDSSSRVFQDKMNSVLEFLNRKKVEQWKLNRELIELNRSIESVLTNRLAEANNNIKELETKNRLLDDRILESYQVEIRSGKTDGEKSKVIRVSLFEFAVLAAAILRGGFRGGGDHFLVLGNYWSVDGWQ